MHRSNQHTRLERIARRHQRQEGAVMLVVMLILLTATAMASFSLQTTQTELRAAGSNRVALQTQYASEAVLVTTLAWIDATSLTGDFVEKQLKRAKLAANLPNMAVFGEPQIDPKHANFANRVTWQEQRDYIAYETAPLTRPKVESGPTQKVDQIGSFGPRSAYVPGVPPPTTGTAAPADLLNFVADIYDCQELPPIAAAGSQVNDTGPGVARGVQYYCVVTSRGSSYLPGTTQKKWTLANGEVYWANRFATSHDMRMTMVTPVVLKQ